MSNYLAIATATAALGQIIGQAMQAVPKLSGAPVIKLGPPDKPEPGFVGVSAYLFRAGPNAALRNEDLATRLDDGTLIKRPRAALNLDYLISFYGDESQLEPQRLMGSVVAALHAEPLLSQERLHQTIATAGSDSFLHGSDLEKQIEQVRLSPLHLTLEDMAKLWSVFFLQVPHALSVCYSASVVLIDAMLTPVTIGPAKTRNISVASSDEWARAKSTSGSR